MYMYLIIKCLKLLMRRWKSVAMLYISAYVCCKDIISPFIACLFVFNSFLVTFKIERFSLSTCLMSFCSFASFCNADLLCSKFIQWKFQIIIC